MPNIVVKCWVEMHGQKISKQEGKYMTGESKVFLTVANTPLPLYRLCRGDKY